MKKSLILTITIAITLYLVGSFYAASLDISEWSEFSREVISVTFILIAFAVNSLVYLERGEYCNV